MTRTIEELLPFYINGTLEEKERAAVEKALRDNPALCREKDYLESLRAEMQAMAAEPGLGALGLKRLQKALAEEKRQNDPIARARRKIAIEQNRGWKALAVAACLLLVVQTVVMLPHWQAGDLRAAGGPAGTTQQAVFSVTFVPGASEAAIRSLLNDLGVQITGGPSALGLYRISGGDDPVATLQALQSRTGIVESVQEETP